MHRERNTTSGFTIVELLIVIVIIAILAAITVVAYNGIQDRARKSAEAATASQAEHQIMAYAATQGNDIANVSSKLVGYQEGVGSVTLLQPLTGTPDITMYTVCSAVSTATNYQPIARLVPRDISTQTFQIQVGPSGSSSIGYRIDTTAQANAGINTAGVRVPGNSVVGWIQVSGGLTAHASGWNQAAPSTTGSLAPGAGWNFTGLETLNEVSCPPKITLVFSAAHDQATRASVIGWLADRYGISL